ncbi:Na(+)/H(+) exchange regulatory cofactor NHE-RF1 [Periophthalmus magnuspinnatus]|uniref:Na(+)/H(+) exchange regulatory cofactor NHE-RF1 n=1 Tax=Periophthalmus magnuspinnatus TaxID=409849 RepID=UPI00145A490F|nr:Na(+)/H(+) exchange regulatory cofactor NHE-RF1 [Periophthalmus magnuspinnatus]
MPSKSQYLRPRLCTLEKGDNGYGFHLHGEKGKTGQFIRLVEPDSPAESSGLRAGDRLVFVNGEDVESESHQQVVSRIRATAGLLELIVVDPETEQLLKRHNLKCQKEYVTEGVPVEEEEEEEGGGEEQEEQEEEVEVEEQQQQVEEGESMEAQDVDGMENGEDRRCVKEDEEVVTEVAEERQEETHVETNEETHVETNEETHEETHEETNEETHEEDAQRDATPRQSTPVPESNGDIHNHVEKKLSVHSDDDCVKEESTALRPRLCVIQRGPNGYGFNLHSERARPGQFIRAVDEDSPAERAGLQPQDRIVQVNGVSVEGKTHSQVVSIIKAGGTETRLLVVDPETDAFFKRCRVVPREEHLTGPLPEPVVNGGIEDKVNGRDIKEPEQESKLSVSPSPSNASSNTSLTTPTANTPPEGLITEAIPALNLSLQQVKELAHQKRSNKRAPPMDWTKKNELFSNL